MAGNKSNRCRILPVGNGNTCIGGRSCRRCHSGNHFKVDSFSSQFFNLFTTPAKDKRIASFQTHHDLSGHCPINQHLVNLFLGMGMLHPTLFTGIDKSSISRDMFQEFRICQIIVDNYLRLFKKILATNGDQAGISRAGTYQINLSRSVLFFLFHFLITLNSNY